MENQIFFSCCLDLSCYSSCKSPNDLFCQKSKLKLSCPSLLSSRHQLIVHSNFQSNWSCERPWNHLAPMYCGKVSAKKGHGSAAELESKSSLFPNHSFHLDSDISLYTSFECQVKCTSNLESALSVTVHRITVQILIAAATVQLLK